MRAGNPIRFIPATGDGRTPDILMGGEIWELKSPKGNGKETIIGMINSARGQAPRLVIDLARTPLSLEAALAQVDYCLARYRGLEAIYIITKDRHLVERSVQCQIG